MEVNSPIKQRWEDDKVVSQKAKKLKSLIFDAPKMTLTEAEDQPRCQQ